MRLARLRIRVLGAPAEQSNKQKHHMKKPIIAALIGVSAMTLLTGCLSIQLGGGTTSRPQSVSVGQQLLDLQKAKDAGVITDAEYQAQKAKFLNEK